MTQMQMDEFDFSGHQGAAVAEAANKGGDFEREIMWLSLKGDPASVQQGKNRTIIRLLTEYEKKPWMGEGPVTRFNFAWITVPQHYAPTKQRPPYAREGAAWPEKWSAVCRKGPVFAGKYGNSCHLCDNVQNKPSDRTWALAIEREQVIENGQIVGIRDKTREVFVYDDNGDPIVERMDGDKKVYAKKIVPAYLVLNFGWKNFFNALNGNASWHQTVLDRDYVVQRSGTGGSDTNYTFVPLDPIILQNENPWGLAGGSKYDLGMIVGNDNGRPVPLMEALYPDMPDLRRIIAERTTDDYYGRWFVPGWLPKDFDPSKVAGQQQAMGGGYMPQGGQQMGYQPIQQGGAGGYVPPQQQAQPQQPTQTPAQPQPQQASVEPTPDMLSGLKNRVLAGQQGQAAEQAPQGQATGQ